MMLSDAVTVVRRFQRSVRVDTDLEATGALHGFVCQGSSKMALETMAKLMVETAQRAFTWTGPYGGGKSSLALALCASISSNPKLRRRARALLDDVPDFDQAFPVGRDGWLVVPVVGRRGDPIEDLREGIARAVATEAGIARTRRCQPDKSGHDVIDRLQREAKARSKEGVLVIFDEMGNLLRGAVGEGTDIHFFQDLAEAAGRCEGRMVVLGILHQAFEQYAARLGWDVQAEWAKVQGRFVDIPIITAVDEVIDLIGRAIVSEIEHPTSMVTAERIAEAIRRRQSGRPEDLAKRLDACWPLHPATAALLGPVSRRRFGQNERSTFGFLGSNEPEGFQEFLRAVPTASGETYNPARLWDYLRINLEPAILAPPEGHRWAQGAEAVERCENRGSPLHIHLAKTIAVIDLFRNGSGLMPERSVLYASLGDVPEEQVNRALNDLESWSIVIFRKHLDAWAIYAGSDFDIVEAVEAAKSSASGLDLARLARLAEIPPLLAKQHYHRTGTLRWFETGLVALSEAKEAAQSFKSRTGSSGKFLLAIPNSEETDHEAKEICRHMSELAGDYPVVFGMPRNAWVVRQLGSELVALETVRASHQELEGDAVARCEIAARLAAVSVQLEEALRTSFNEAIWYVRGKAKNKRGARGLAQLASHLADETFSKAATIHNELINREKPSSNGRAAVRLLLHAMVSKPAEKYLGLEGFKPERGLYSTVLEKAGLHGQRGGALGFKGPNTRKAVGASFVPMWRKAEELLEAADEPVQLSSLYAIWTVPPFGIRRGLLPILTMAFILAHESSVAVYAEETFQPELNNFFADCLLQDEKLISLRRVDRGAENEHLMKEIAEAMGEITGNMPAVEPLAVTRALVEFVFRLPNWTHRASSLSKTAQNVRRILLNASDPHKALFVDLPHAAGYEQDQSPGTMITSSFHELAEAYQAMLEDLQRRMLNALGHKRDSLEELRKRALIVKGLSGDIRLEAFVNRLAEFHGHQEDMEAIAGLVIHKPARKWSDLDSKQAVLSLAELALRFRQVEILARVKGREPTQHAVTVAFGTGEAGRTVTRNFNVAEADRVEIRNQAEQVIAMLRRSGLSGDMLFAALAEAGLRAVDETELDEQKVVAS